MKQVSPRVQMRIVDTILTSSSEFQMWDIFVSDKDGPWAEFRQRIE
jgi:hypothetical protein